MLIECVLQRDEPIVVPISNEVYRFEPDAAGRRVAEVWIESHVEAFLAVPHLYRIAREDGRERPEADAVSEEPPAKADTKKARASRA